MARLLLMKLPLSLACRFASCCSGSPQTLTTHGFTWVYIGNLQPEFLAGRCCINCISTAAAYKGQLGLMKTQVFGVLSCRYLAAVGVHSPNLLLPPSARAASQDGENGGPSPVGVGLLDPVANKHGSKEKGNGESMKPCLPAPGAPAA
eukprot:832787-Pelagomonas_calceolata.AAC.3